MSGIALGGDYTIAQPSGIIEGVTQKVTDRSTIKGQTRRIWMAQKHTVKLTWDSITQTDYSYIVNKFYGTGSTITYTNTYSGVSITGFATAVEGDFIKGASFKRSLTITIVEA